MDTSITIDNQNQIFTKAMQGCSLRILCEGGARKSAIEVCEGNENLVYLLIDLAAFIEEQIRAKASLEDAIDAAIKAGFIRTINAFKD